MKPMNIPAKSISRTIRFRCHRAAWIHWKIKTRWIFWLINTIACATALKFRLAVSVTIAPTSWPRRSVLAGYSQDDLEKKFGGMLNAFRFGPPPHGGCAFGIDRMIMLIANEPNLREVYAFVMNGNYEDPMMNAPGTLTEQQQQDLHLKVVLPIKKEPKAANG